MKIWRLVNISIIVLAAGFGLFMAGRELRVSLFEKEPTRMTAAEFAERYDGQVWLSMQGRLVPGRADIRESTHQTHAGMSYAYIKVPMVPPDWQPSEPVHLVINYGPVQSGAHAELSARAADPETEVTGLAAPPGAWDLERIFPGLRFEDPVIVLNNGTEPGGTGLSLILVGIMGIVFIISVVMLLNLLRDWKKQSTLPTPEDFV